MENIENTKQDRFYSKFLKIPLVQKLTSIKIGRLLFLFVSIILITLVCVMDIDTLPIYVSTILDIIATLIFFILTIWRLNDMGRSRWLALGIIITFGIFYIDNDIVTEIATVIFLAIVVLLSYLPPNSIKKLEESEETKNNMTIKHKIFNKKTIMSFVLGLIVMFGAGYAYFYYIKNNNCLFSNIGVVEIFGNIDIIEDPDYASTSSLNVVQQIEELSADANIKGILLDISSSGGYTEPSEEIMLAVQRISKPVVTVIRDMGNSGAYMIASATDRIYANRMSDVGSIGVTMEFLDTSEKDRIEGVILYDFSSGKYKGTFKEHSKMTQEEKEMIMKGIMKSHDIFVEYVAKNRNIPIEEVKKIATGESWVGQDALELRLIDQIGGMPEADSWLQGQIGEETSYCSLKE